MSDANTGLPVSRASRFAISRRIATFCSAFWRLIYLIGAWWWQNDLDRANGPALRDLARRGDLPPAILEQIEAKQARSIALTASYIFAVSIPTDWTNRKDRP